MTGPQLKALREARGMTQPDLAEYLGDSTAATISRWEKGIHAIPQWVSDKMLASATVSLPLSLLGEFWELSQRSQLDFSEFLVTAIREYLARQKAPVDYTALPPIESARVAEDPPSPPPQ